MDMSKTNPLFILKKPSNLNHSEIKTHSIEKTGEEIRTYNSY